MHVLKDLKRHISPPLAPLVTPIFRRARACPSPCLGAIRCLAGDRPPRYGFGGYGLSAKSAQDVRSRGKPARLRVWQARAPRAGFGKDSPLGPLGPKCL